MRTISINHNKVNQFFKKFKSSIKNLVCESLNQTKKQSTQYVATLKKIS